ncbi:unnamed protein product, partial [Amoebophrya sp. A25]|eukprot:GSA25T00017449001.1
MTQTKTGSHALRTPEVEISPATLWEKMSGETPAAKAVDRSRTTIDDDESFQEGSLPETPG